MTTTELTEPTGEAPPTTRLTVIIETATREEYAGHGFDLPEAARALDALGAGHSACAIQVLVMVDRDGPQPRLTAARDRLAFVPVDDPTYYTMKITGAREATSEYVAFLDGDCVPEPGWAAAAIAALDRGADVVAGKSRYAGPGACARLMSYFDLGTVSTRADGTATAYHFNNVAFRRKVFLTTPPDTRFKRSGGCVLENLELRADGRRIVYEPAMFVTHGNDYKLGFGLSKRFGSGHNTVKVLQLDERGVMPHRWIIRLGPAGAALLVGGRIWNDLFLLARQHRDLGIPVLTIPIVLLIAVPMRLLEGVGYALSTVKPSIIGKYWG